MKRYFIQLCLVSFVVSGCAELKSAGREVEQTTKKVTRDIGHATRDAAKSVGEEVKKATK